MVQLKAMRHLQIIVLRDEPARFTTGEPSKNCIVTDLTAGGVVGNLDRTRVSRLAMIPTAL